MDRRFDRKCILLELAKIRIQFLAFLASILRYISGCRLIGVTKFMPDVERSFMRNKIFKVAAVGVIGALITCAILSMLTRFVLLPSLVVGGLLTLASLWMQLETVDQFLKRVETSLAESITILDP